MEEATVQNFSYYRKGFSKGITDFQNIIFVGELPNLNDETLENEESKGANDEESEWTNYGYEDGKNFVESLILKRIITLDMIDSIDNPIIAKENYYKRLNLFNDSKENKLVKTLQSNNC